MKTLFQTALLICLIIPSLNAQSWVLEQKLFADEQQAGDHFGADVAIDGSFAIIGAPYDDGLETNAGAAYIFRSNKGEWQQVAKLTASDGHLDHKFGFNVDIQGDIAIVANKDIYVYEKPATGWIDMAETARLSASESTTNTILGNDIALDNDIIVTGSEYKSGNKIDSTAVYLFQKPVSGWVDTTETAILKASDGDTLDGFGMSVDIHDNEIIVGAMTKNDLKGCAYIFERPTGGWKNTTETAILRYSNQKSWDLFGHSVSICNDYAVVGAPGGGISGYDPGYACVFEKPDLGWEDTIESAVLRASDIESLGFFGYRTDVFKNIIIISSWQGVYLFQKPGNGWKDTTETDVFFPQIGDCIIGISGDYAIAGNQQNNELGENAGVAFIFTPSLPRPLFQPTDTIGVCPGKAATFTCQGHSTKTYQWQVSNIDGSAWELISDNAHYTGSQEQTLTVIATTDLDSTLYRCVLSNNYDSCITDAALFTIENEPPIITSDHPDQILEGNDNDEAVLPDFTSFVTAIDNCSEELQISQIPEANTVVSGSDNIVTLTINDDAGNGVSTSFNVVVTPGTNIPTQIADNFIVYPNPAQDELNFSFDVPVDKLRLIIYNALGEEILTVENDHTTNTYSLDLRAIKSGIYLVYIQYNTIMKSIKILVNK